MSIFGPIVTAMVTPFNEDGTVNYKQTIELIDYLIQKQVYLYQEDVFCYLQSVSQIPKERKLYRKLSWN